MTVKEIAKAVNKPDRSVRRWVNKAADKITAIKDKMTASNSNHPANYNLDETIEIIKIGLGANAAELYRQNAEAKTSVPDPAPDYNIIGKMIGTAITAALTPIIQELKQIKNQPLQLEQPKQDYYSLLGYCNHNNIKISFSESKKMGMSLRRLTLERGYELRKVPDGRYGEVNSYPLEILDEYFSV